MVMEFPSSIKRFAQIAGFELVRVFLTKRGLASLVAFSLVWLLILRYPIGEAVELLNSPNFESAARDISGAIGLQALIDWPEPELAMYWLVALYTFPLFSLFICSDQTVGDRERGTLRFLLLRATRTEIILGRFAGQLIISGCLLTITIFATLVVLGMRDANLLIGGMLRAASIFTALLIVLCPFIAIMSFINTFARSSRLALVFAVLFFTAGNFVVEILAWSVPVLESLKYIFPGVQISQLAMQSLSLPNTLGIPLLQTLVFLLLAQRLFARSSL